MDCKKAIPRENIKVKKVERNENRRIFIGGLPPDVDKASLANFFSKYGEVEYCIVITDKSTNKSRGKYIFNLF